MQQSTVTMSHQYVFSCSGGCWPRRSSRSYWGNRSWITWSEGKYKHILLNVFLVIYENIYLRSTVLLFLISEPCFPRVIAAIRVYLVLLAQKVKASRALWFV